MTRTPKHLLSFARKREEVLDICVFLKLGDPQNHRCSLIMPSLVLDDLGCLHLWPCSYGEISGTLCTNFPQIGRLDPFDRNMSMDRAPLVPQGSRSRDGKHTEGT